MNIPFPFKLAPGMLVAVMTFAGCAHLPPSHHVPQIRYSVSTSDAHLRAMLLSATPIGSPRHEVVHFLEKEMLAEGLPPKIRVEPVRTPKDPVIATPKSVAEARTKIVVFFRPFTTIAPAVSGQPVHHTPGAIYAFDSHDRLILIQATMGAEVP